MTLKNRCIFFLAFWVLTKNSYAENLCPDWVINRPKDVPQCPEGGLVPETFPVGAVVVSDVGYMGKDSGFTADVVQKILRASGPRNPLFILPASQETIQLIKTQIDDMPIPDDMKIKYKQSIVQVPSNGYIWQQDYFQAFTYPWNGQVVLREIPGDHLAIDGFNRIMKAAQSCGFAQGSPLPTNELVSGHLGGNIETLPSGICLLGDDNFPSKKSWEDYASQICNREMQNTIKVPTSWLRVGHTDEIIKVVRNKTKQAPCDFSVVLASPNKAIELLKKHQNKKFLNFAKARGGFSTDLAISRSNGYHGIKTLCQKVVEQKNHRQPERKNNDMFRGTKAISKLFELHKIFLSDALAGIGMSRGAASGELNDCAQMTNGDIYKVLTEDNELYIYNQLVQKTMESLKKEVEQKLKDKLPQCQIDFIEVPDIFWGGYPVAIDKDQYELPKNMGLSVLPNPTNSISVEDTVIAPDPTNEVFQKYLEDEYNKRGLNVEFVDTFDFAHRGDGNLHCVTNTIHICQPRGR